MSDESKKGLRCSFCGKHESQVHRMIQGPGVRICDECVQLFMSILNDGFEDTSSSALEDLPDQLRPAPAHKPLQILPERTASASPELP